MKNTDRKDRAESKNQIRSIFEDLDSCFNFLSRNPKNNNYIVKLKHYSESQESFAYLSMQSLIELIISFRPENILTLKPTKYLKKKFSELKSFIKL